MITAITLLSLSAFMAWAGTALPFVGRKCLHLYQTHGEVDGNKHGMDIGCKRKGLIICEVRTLIVPIL
jgi:hypothetical protein